MKKKILLVEDEAIIAMNKSALLKKNGYEVVTAFNAKKAISAVEDNSIDLILMDIDLGSGKMDGTEAAEIILQNHDIPVVFLSSHTEPEVVEKTEKITSYGYVVKNSGAIVLDTSIKMAFKLFNEKIRLLEKDNELKEILEATTDGIWKWNFKDNTLFFSDKYYKMLGYNPGDFPASYESWMKLIHPADLEMALETAERYLKTKPDLYENQFRLKTKDGGFKWVKSTARIAKRDTNNEPVYMIGNHEDITEQKQAEEQLKDYKDDLENLVEERTSYIEMKIDELKQSEAALVLEKNKLENVTRNISAGLCIISKDYRTIWANEVLKNIFGDVEGKICHKLYNQQNDICQDCGAKKVFETGAKEAISEQVGKDANGNTIWSQIIVTPLYDEDGNVSSALELVIPITERTKAEDELNRYREKLEIMVEERTAELEREITERKQAEEQAQEQRERLRKIIENSPLSIVEIDTSGHYVLVNEATYALLNTTKEELLGKHFEEVMPPETASVYKERIDHVSKTGKMLTVDDTLNIDQQEKIVRTVIFPIYRPGEAPPSIIGIAYEITKEMRLLEQKDFLMKELNHRVKNNLAMVNSLISLKSSAVGDSIDLSDLSNQIEAIRIVHEKLHHTDDINHINIRDYFEELLQNIFSSFSTIPVTIEQKVGEIVLEAKRAIPIGLIINEIATNAIKYGFNHEEEAVFSVKMDFDKKKDVYTLLVSNTGNSFPEDINIDNPNTLGLRLITALVEQLNGTIELQKKPYPVFTIRFPVGEE